MISNVNRNSIIIIIIIIIIIDLLCLGSLLFTGVLNLVVVSYDRLTAIVTPLEARLTVHGAHIVIASTWVTGVILGLPLIFFRLYRVRFRTRISWKIKGVHLPFTFCMVFACSLDCEYFVNRNSVLTIKIVCECRPRTDLNE